MRRGNLRPRPRPRPRRQRGIAYVGVLMLVAALGLGMTEATRIWHTVRQREREAELLFVGDQYRTAIGRYYSAAGQYRYPASLDALLEDRRTLPTRRHLRRLYADPLTGSPRWGIVKAPDGGIMGVFSEASGKPMKRAGFATPYETFADRDSYAEWAFVYLPPAADAGSPSAAGPSSAAPIH